MYLVCQRFYVGCPSLHDPLYLYELGIGTMRSTLGPQCRYFLFPKKEMKMKNVFYNPERLMSRLILVVLTDAEVF